MSELLTNPAFKLYVIFAATLLFNSFALAAMTAAARGKYKSPASPEDSGMTGNPFKEEVAPEVDRLIRAHRNALENIPMTLTLGLVYVLTGASAMMVGIFMGIFTLFRLLHSVFYLKGVQPWRTASFVVAGLSAGAMAVHAVIRVLAA